MKLNFETKLGVGIFLVFAVVIAGFMLWTPIRVKYYSAKLHSKDKDERLAGLRGLVSLGEPGGKALAKFCGSEEEGDFIYKIWKGPEKKKVRDGLQVAVKNGYMYAAGFLIDNGSDMNSNVVHLGRPLSCAIKAGNLGMVKLLVERGADIQSTSFPEFKPVIMAAEKGQAKILCYLLEKGASVNHVTYSSISRKTSRGTESELISQTAMDRAKNGEVRKILRTHGGKTYRRLEAEAQLRRRK